MMATAQVGWRYRTPMSRHQESLADSEATPGLDSESPETISDDYALLVESPAPNEDQEHTDEAEHELEEEISKYEITFRHHKICSYLDKAIPKGSVSYEYFHGEDRYLSQCGTEGTFIHVLVLHIKKLLSDKKEKLHEWWLSAIPNIVSWFIFHYPDLLIEADSAGRNAFELATEKCIPVAYCILELVLDDEAKRLVETPCHRDSEGTCTKTSTHPLLNLFEKLANGNDWYPINENCGKHDRSTILAFHERFENILRSAVKLNRGLTTPCLHNVLENFHYLPNRAAAERLVNLSSEEVVMAQDKKTEATPLLIAVRAFRIPKPKDGIALMQLTHIIQLLVHKYPKAIYHSTPGHETIYGELLSYCSTKETGNGDHRLRVVDILKEAIIGDAGKSHQAKLNYLNPSNFSNGDTDEPTVARKICLDLGTSEPIGAGFVNAIIKQSFDVFKFESVLSYIRLPPRKLSTMPIVQGKETDDLETYEDIFKFLREEGVRKIFTVIVNDLTGQPHTDEMIINLLKGFEVEHWEWKKLDMNIETILRTAPHVKTVSLHSSGSYSALQGWACETGLITLKNLTKANVTIHRGAETEASLQEYKDKFKDNLKTRFQNQKRHLEIEVGLGKSIADEAEFHDLKTDKALETHQKLNHDWIRHMEMFVSGLKNLELRMSRKVKVALIDDGIDPVEINFKVADGRAFRENDQHASDDNYYVEAGPHGTVMATLIHKMCPMVELLVARLVPNAYSKIPASAAEKALKWASEEKKADIISMSWTFDKKADGAEDFKKAVEAAAGNALIFSSLREAEGSLVIEDFYPVSCTRVFRIGSATRSGNLAKSFSGDLNNVHFILPGREVQLRWRGDSKEINGSSLATALASGLAALILYCADRSDENPSDTNTQHGNNLRHEQNMRKVFGNMSRASNEGSYPEVQKYFNMPGKDLTLSNVRETISSLTAGLHFH